MLRDNLLWGAAKSSRKCCVLTLQSETHYQFGGEQKQLRQERSANNILLGRVPLSFCGYCFCNCLGGGFACVRREGMEVFIMVHLR